MRSGLLVSKQFFQSWAKYHKINYLGIGGTDVAKIIYYKIIDIDWY